MIKKGIKNYFSSLKYFFTPLGTMFLGLMLGASILINLTVSATETLVSGIGELIDRVSLDPQLLFDSLWTFVLELNWNEPLEALGTMFTGEWLNGALTAALSAILGTDFDAFTVQIAELVGGFVSNIVVGIVMLLVFWVIGFFVGYVVIKIQIRRNIAKRTIWKYVVSSVIDALFATLLLVVGAYVTELWQPSVIVVMVLLPFVFGFMSLMKAYIVYGRDKIEIKQVVSLGNTAKCVAVSALILVIALAMSVAVMLINSVIGIFVALVFLQIALIVMSMNCESFVLEKIKDGPKQPEKPTACIL